MFKQIFGSDKAAGKITDGVYDQIVAAARRPVLYAGTGVSSGHPLGRYEMISLRIFPRAASPAWQAGVVQEMARTTHRPILWRSRPLDPRTRGGRSLRAETHEEAGAHVLWRVKRICRAIEADKATKCLQPRSRNVRRTGRHGRRR